jgi:hypothetical protein
MFSGVPDAAGRSSCRYTHHPATGTVFQVLALPTTTPGARMGQDQGQENSNNCQNRRFADSVIFACKHGVPGRARCSRVF